jgi:hypothetical protein
MIPKEFTVEQKVQIAIDSFSAANIAGFIRKHHFLSIAESFRWEERFL